jgi:hypothetical protein
VTCREVTLQMCICSQGLALPTEAARHIAACRHCNRLARILEISFDDGLPQTDRWEGIRSHIARDLKPVRPLAPRGIYALAVGLIFIAVILAGLAAPGAATGWEALGAGQRLGVFTVLALSAALLDLCLVSQMAPGSRNAISPAALLAGVPVVLALTIALLFRPQQESEFVANGATCFRTGLSYSVPAALSLCLALHCGVFQRPVVSGMVLGGVAGLIGLTILEMNCSNPDFFHILRWHAGAAVASSLAGGAFGALFGYFTRRVNRRPI